MNVFVQLPERVDPNEPKLRLWSGEINEIPDLLNERKRQVARNWYSTATFPDSHPYANRIRKEMKRLAANIVEREAVAQVEFLAAIKARRDEQVLAAKGDPQIAEWYRPGRVQSTEKRWAPIALILGD